MIYEDMRILRCQYLYMPVVYVHARVLHNFLYTLLVLMLHIPYVKCQFAIIIFWISFPGAAGCPTTHTILFLFYTVRVQVCMNACMDLERSGDCGPTGPSLLLPTVVAVSLPVLFALFLLLLLLLAPAVVYCVTRPILQLTY